MLLLNDEAGRIKLVTFATLKPRYETGFLPQG